MHTTRANVTHTYTYTHNTYTCTRNTHVHTHTHTRTCNTHTHNTRTHGHLHTSLPAIMMSISANKEASFESPSLTRNIFTSPTIQSAQINKNPQAQAISTKSP